MVKKFDGKTYYQYWIQHNNTVSLFVRSDHRRFHTKLLGRFKVKSFKESQETL